MSGVQKIIKYLAIALAIFLIFSIISGITVASMAIGNAFSNSDNETLENLEEIGKSDTISSLYIDISSSSLIIKTGESFKVESNNPNITYKEENGRVILREKGNSWFKDNDNAALVISIPDNLILGKTEIDSGAGILEISDFKTDILELDLGAGKVNINNLVVNSETIIDGGAGEVTIENSSLKNLDLDMGVGKFTLNAEILGSSEIEHGVGEAIINLIGSEEDYQIYIDKGIGSITIDGNTLGKDTTYGNGRNKIDIEGGVGSITVNFQNNYSDLDLFYKNDVIKYTDTRFLADTYDIKDAINDNCMVISGAKVYNDNLYNDFWDSYKNDKSSFIRVVATTAEGDLIIYDLLYNSTTKKLELVADTTRDNYTADKKIEYTQYENMAEYEYENNLYWVVYNNELNEITFNENSTFVIALIS